MKHDIVIPYHPKDAYTINECIKSCNNIVNKNNIFIISSETFDHPNVKWVDEKTFPFTKKDITLINPQIPQDRAGWYYQQLVKLHLFLIEELTETFLVLDSDVIFLRAVNFIEEETPLYSYTHEYTPDYFDCMTRLNPFFERSVNVSGICHHMMFEKSILKEIFALISKPNKDIWQTIIENVNNWHHGFSEYELYFHYIHKKTPKKYKIRKLIYEDVFDFKNTLNLTHVDYIANHEWKRQEILKT
jgi:hypothetical protein